MNSMRKKWRGLSGAASGAFVFAALSGGCSSIQCNLYDCSSFAVLSGSVVIAKEVSVVDFRLCVGSKCKEDSIDLAEVDAGLPPCLPWGSETKVCLAKTSAPETFALNADWEFDHNDAPHDATVQLTLVDHVSGSILLDETRTAKVSDVSRDNCHVCWAAEATL
jgi:hypothetical protein